MLLCRGIQHRESVITVLPVTFHVVPGAEAVDTRLLVAALWPGSEGLVSHIT